MNFTPKDMPVLQSWHHACLTKLTSCLSYKVDIMPVLQSWHHACLTKLTSCLSYKVDIMPVLQSWHHACLTKLTSCLSYKVDIMPVLQSWHHACLTKLTSCLCITWRHHEPGPCITNVFATRRKNFSQWHRSFQRKLRSHWLKFLRHVAITLVIQGPGRCFATLGELSKWVFMVSYFRGEKELTSSYDTFRSLMTPPHQRCRDVI